MLRLGPVRRRVRRQSRRPDPANGSRPHRTASTSARCSPRLPEVLRTPSGPNRTRAGAADRRRRAAAGVARPRRRRLRADRSHGICAPTTAGCTTCPRSRAAPTAARCRSIPTTPPNSGSTDTAVDQGPRRRAGGAGRADRRACGAAWCRCRTAGVTTAAAPGQGVAADQPGVNVNQLNDGSQLDPLSGTAVLNGIPVDIAPAD